VVHVPGAPAEATIALSILLASEIVRMQRGEASLTARWPWVVAFTFGLLHGSGFAGALTQIGLPSRDVPLALFAFTVGVELRQLAFIGAVSAPSDSRGGSTSRRSSSATPCRARRMRSASSTACSASGGDR